MLAIAGSAGYKGGAAQLVPPVGPTNAGNPPARNREHFKIAIYFYLGGLQLHPTAP